MSEQTEGEREHEARIRKEAIRLGLIDLGPQVLHTTVTDTRDLRDPHALGSAIQKHLDVSRRHGETIDRQAKKATLAADLIENNSNGRLGDWMIPDYARDESTVQGTAQDYRAKMQRQAAIGDVYALRVLLDKEWPLPSDIDQDLVARAQEMRGADDEVVE